MGGLVQQINLYRGYAAKAEAPKGAQMLLFAGIGGLLVVVTLAFAGEIYLSSLSAERAKVATSLERHEAKLTKFRETLRTPGIDPFLQSELARLRDVRRHLDANLAAIARHNDDEQAGFAEYFSGLARNTLDGLWLIKVGVWAGGTRLLLKGQTTKPALVPRMLQTLAGEPVFAGRTFRKVTFARRTAEPGDGWVDFELRSARTDEAEDAG